jgi:hypothetical protein
MAWAHGYDAVDRDFIFWKDRPGPLLRAQVRTVGAVLFMMWYLLVVARLFELQGLDPLWILALVLLAAPVPGLAVLSGIAEFVLLERRIKAARSSSSQ